jgi:hypothetical protein
VTRAIVGVLLVVASFGAGWVAKDATADHPELTCSAQVSRDYGAGQPVVGSAQRLVCR